MAWFDNNWIYKKKITIDSSKVDGDVTDFPVLIHLDSDSDLSAEAQSSGDDILFTNEAEDTQLDHEIENYDGGTGTLWAHVKVPSVSGSSDTVIYIYYGNSGASNQENVTGVWSNGYEGVYHLNEEASGVDNTGVYKDSTSNARDADDKVSDTGQGGKISDGQTFDGSDDWIRIPHKFGIGEIDEYSVSGWFRSTRPNNGDFIVSLEHDFSTPWQMGLGWSSTGKLDFYNGSKYHQLGDVVSDEWHNFYLTLDKSRSGDGILGYFDGSQSVTIPNDHSDGERVGHNVLGDHEPNGGAYFSGSFDEYRISSTARSDAWISTTYNNQNDPSSFYTVGSEEVNAQTINASVETMKLNELSPKNIAQIALSRVSQTGKNSGKIISRGNSGEVISRKSNSGKVIS